MANFNPLANFNQGLGVGQDIREAQRQNQIGALQQVIAQQTAQGGFNPNNSLEFQQLSALDPSSGARILSTFNSLDENRKKAAFQDARKSRKLLEDGNGQGFLDVVQDRINNVERLGGDSSGTRSVLDTFNSGDIQGTLQQLRNTEQIGVDLGMLSDPLKAQRSKDQQRTANARDWDKFQSLIKSDPKKGEQFGRKAGFIRPTEQQKSDIKITESEKKAMAKANISRKQGFIDSGIEAANGSANLNRALTLLDGVGTGGFDNLALKVKQAFGIEGADEGELSSLMGKAVLAQLKPIFGAAFTASEGESLARLEAQFGRSPKTNKKLIENALKIVNRSARRGIAAAEDQGDSFTADEIRSSMAFKLSDKNESSQAQAPQTFNSTILGRSVSEQDINDTLQANPGLTREQLLQQLGVN